MKQFLFAFVTLASFLLGASQSLADGGHVLPPNLTPFGYTLEDMAEELAYFSTSGNNLAYFPDTPFQILFNSATNTFTVKSGTLFFVPVFFIDDSPPIIGSFPENADSAEEYVFGAEEMGAYNVSITVEGRVTPIGPKYVAGPVFASGLLDGGGSHFIQVGAFLAPLSNGRHTVTIQAGFDGEALLDFTGSPLFSKLTHTVIVQ
jgi:hypothetical protein